jgi:hypothetical protein
MPSRRFQVWFAVPNSQLPAIAACNSQCYEMKDRSHACPEVEIFEAPTLPNCYCLVALPADWQRSPFCQP